MQLSDSPTQEDIIFKYFQDNFQYGEYLGGDAGDGIRWFFDGSYPPADYFGFDQPYDNTGNCLNISADSYLRTYDADYIGGGQELMNILADSVHNNAGVELGVFNPYMAHSITCYGFSYNSLVNKSSPDYYTGLFISDSDDDKYLDSPTDKIQYLPVHWSEARNCYQFDNYYDYNDVNILTMNVLQQAGSSAYQPYARATFGVSPNHVPLTGAEDAEEVQLVAVNDYEDIQQIDEV